MELDNNISYGSFWQRTWAYLIDSIVVLCINFPIIYYSITELKSFVFYLVAVLIGILYKPLMEYYFGFTLGKKALKLKVVTIDYESINLKQAFLRNSLQILPVLLYIPIYYLAFNDSYLMSIDSYIDFAVQFEEYYPFEKYISTLSFLLLLSEIIFLLSDNKRMRRALHDRFAKTLVVGSTTQKPKEIPPSIEEHVHVNLKSKYGWEKLPNKHIYHLFGLHSFLGVIMLIVSYFGVEVLLIPYIILAYLISIWQTNTLANVGNKREYHFQSRFISTVFVLLNLEIRKYMLFNEFQAENLLLVFFGLWALSGLATLLIYFLPFKLINDTNYYFIRYTKIFPPVLVVLTLIITALNIGFFNPYKGKTIKWDDLNPITIEDFKGYSEPYSEFDAEIKSLISYEFDSNDRIIYIDALMEMDHSWVKAKDKKDKWLMKHESYHFNITEMITRKIRKEVYDKLLNKGTKWDIIKIINENNNILRETQFQYDKETNHSANQDFQSIWEQKIDSTLYLLDPYWTSKIFDEVKPNDKIKYYHNITRNAKQEIVGINLLMPNEEKYANHYRFLYNSENKLKEINFFRLGKKAVDDVFGVSTIKIEYDTNGNYSWIYFDENGNKMLCEDGYYKKEYTYLSKKEIIIKYYDKNNNQINTDFGGYYSKVKLDTLARIVERTFYDINNKQIITDDGYCIRKFYYSDDSFNSSKDENFDFKNKPLNSKENGYKSVYSYDNEGNVTLFYSINVDGSYVIRNGGEKQLYKYDEFGRLNSFMIEDSKDNLVEDENGIAKYEYSYDRYGNVNIKNFYNSNNVLTSITEGYAIDMRKYDKSGNLLSIAFYDPGFMLYFNDDVEGKLVYKYDSLGRQIMSSNLNAYNQPFSTQYRSGVVAYRYDSMNRITSAIFLDESLKLDSADNGVSAYKNIYDEKSNLIEYRYYGKDFKLKNSNEGVSIFKYKYDELGNKIKTSYFTKEGKPTNTTQGAFINKYKYLNNNLIERTYYDTTYNLIEYDGYAKIQWIYDERGNIIEHRLFNKYNSLAEDGTAIYKYTYDVKNRVIEEHQFDFENNSIQLTKSSYQGNILVSETLYSDYNVPTEKNGIFRYQYIRDKRGNSLEQKSFNKLGNLAIDTDEGYAILRNHYDLDYNIISQSYFDELDHLVNLNSKYSTLKLERDNSGHVIKKSYYNSKGELSEDKDGVALYIYEYNRNGFEIESNKYNIKEANKILNINKNEETNELLKTTFKL